MSEIIVIVGIGALGSHLVLLARNWTQKLRLIDFDRVEQKNTLAQFHTKMTLGRNKAQAMRQTLLGLFGTKVDSLSHRLTDDNATQLLGDAKLVIDCTDNAKARRLIQGFVRQHHIPCLHGALSADGGFGRVVWDEHFVIDPEDQEGQATCENAEQLPFFALTAATVALAAQEFLIRGTCASYQLIPSSMLRLV